MEIINIIFIHKGDSWYLPYALNQAVESNPYANIYLLGDESNKKYNTNNVNHFSWEDFNIRAKEFANIYQHFATTDYHHELFCIQRWFVLLEFMKKLNLTNAILLDTDVLLFQDIIKYFSCIDKKFHYTRGTTNHMGFVYIPNRSYLGNICTFMTNLYKNQETLNRLEKDYVDYVKENGIGGVSDITLFEYYQEQNQDYVYNTENPPLNKMAFIHSLESDFYLKDKNNYVAIKWRNEIPYGTFLSTGELISIIGIHCFGLQKTSIRRLYNGKGKWKARLVFIWKKSFFKNILDYLRGRKKISKKND